MNRYGAQDKIRGRILTVDPTTRRVEVATKDAAAIQVAIWEIPNAFRWPVVGELWSLRKEHGYWKLEHRLESAKVPDEDFRIEDMEPGQLKLAGTQIFLDDGTSLVGKAPIGRIEVFVDARDGDDTNDGRSWGTAFETIEAGIAALPHGGKIWVATSDVEYRPVTTLTLQGHSIEAYCRVPGGTQSLAVIRHTFNGDLFSCGSSSAHLKNLLIYANNTPFTGAGLSAVSSSSNGGDILCENCIWSGGVGWQRNVVLDGSAWATFGIRKCVFMNCQFFGVRTAGESIVVTRGVHLVFIGGFQDQARVTDGGFGAVNQGIRILDTGSTGIEFSGFRLIGDFYTESAADLIYTGAILGNITCSASSANNLFIGQISGSITDSGTNNKFDKAPTPKALVTLSSDQSIPDNNTTIVTWDVESQDNNSMVALGTDNTKIIIQTPGEYQVGFVGAFVSNSTGYRGGRILVNGGIRAAQTVPAVNGAETQLAMGRRFTLAKNDFLQASVLQNSGGALNLKSYGASAYSASLECVKVG